MTTVICAPPQLDLDASIQFAKSLKQITPSAHCVFDFGQVNKVRPFGMLRTACAISEFVAQCSEGAVLEIRHRPNNYYNVQALGYAGYMGFFQACGLDYGNAPGGDAGRNYVPITYRNRSELLVGSRLNMPLVMNISDNLAFSLLRRKNGALYKAVSYSFREIIRNTAEHSESASFGYCAQYWPSTEMVEIALVDTGIGLKRSLEDNPHLTVRTDRDAIKYALEPGVSGKVYEGVPDDEDDDLQNSGFGLYLNYRLCFDAGNFFICSGSTGLLRSSVQANNRDFATEFSGTILRLRLYTANLRNPVSLLDRYVREGEKEAANSSLGANVSASKLSRLLRGDFTGLADDITVGSRVRHGRFGAGRVQETIASKPEVLALVLFDGGRRKRVPFSTLNLCDE